MPGPSHLTLCTLSCMSSTSMCTWLYGKYVSPLYEISSPLYIVLPLFHHLCFSISHIANLFNAPFQYHIHLSNLVWLGMSSKILSFISSTTFHSKYGIEPCHAKTGPEIFIVVMLKQACLLVTWHAVVFTGSNLYTVYLYLVSY